MEKTILLISDLDNCLRLPVENIIACHKSNSGKFSKKKKKWWLQIDCVFDGKKYSYGLTYYKKSMQETMFIQVSNLLK